MKSSDGFFEGVGGLRLYYRAWELPRARAAIAVVHGLGDHGGRYDAVAHRLAAYGFSTFALDLRGHGLSEGRRGHVKRFGAYLQDVDRFRRELHGLVDVGTPLFLLGLPDWLLRPLVALAGRLRALKGQDLEEGVSTRLIVYCATLIAAGLPTLEAVLAGMIEPLTDEADVKAALLDVARAVIG